MKVITIKQPFASLIAAGLKEYEFRTWKTKYRVESVTGEKFARLFQYCEAYGVGGVWISTDKCGENRTHTCYREA